MDPIDTLFIRACKLEGVEKQFKRFKSIIRRFYLVEYTHKDRLIYVMTDKLAEICQEYNLVSIMELISHLRPQNAWKYDEELTLHECVFHTPKKISDNRFDVLLSIIRYSSVDKFPGMRKPARFRNK